MHRGLPCGGARRRGLGLGCRQRCRGRLDGCSGLGCLRLLCCCPLCCLALLGLSLCWRWVSIGGWGGCLHWDGGGRSCGHAVLLRGHDLSTEARQRCVLCPHRCDDRRRWHRRLRESSGALEHLQSSRPFWWCQFCPGHAARCRRRRGQTSGVRGRLKVCVLCTCALCRWVSRLHASAHTRRCHVSSQ